MFSQEKLVKSNPDENSNVTFRKDSAPMSSTNSESANEGKCGWTTKALKYIVFGWPLATSYILKTHT